MSLYETSAEAGDSIRCCLAWNVISNGGTHDAAAVASMIYPGAVAFDGDYPFALVAPTENAVAQITDSYKAVFEQLEYQKGVPYNTQHKVIGNTGIAYGFLTLSSKPKGGQAQAKHYRSTSTWIKSGGKWMITTSHMSTIPSGD